MIAAGRAGSVKDARLALRGQNSSNPTSYGFLGGQNEASVRGHRSTDPEQAANAPLSGGGDGHDGEGDGTRSMALFDRLPAGFIAFAIPDHSCDPLIRRGEIAVVDPSDRELVFGALYLRRSVSSNGTARVRVVENLLHMARFVGMDDSAERVPCSILVEPNRPLSRSIEHWRAWSERFGPVPMGDGPYQLDLPIARKEMDSLIGRVVGILVANEPEV